MNNLNIELHLIQNFAPSCLNRDETNAPKDCDFGGVRRARISSQSIKHAVRNNFKTNPAISVGHRTKHLKDLLTERLQDNQYDPKKLSQYLDDFIAAYFSKMDKAKGKEHLTSVLLYLGESELQHITSLIVDGLETGKKFQKDKSVEAELKSMAKAADIALFGRMMAENPELNIDAACQVAHAFSTHRVDMDFDFYTAVDDLNPKEETGAGMMGNTGFNSACFYRYSLVNWRQLLENLDGDRETALGVMRAFIEASVLAIPTGKQNAFAAQNLPLFGLFILRKNGAPCSLANAFARPVNVIQSLDEDLVGRSIESLNDFYDRYQKTYGSDDVVSESLFNIADGERLASLKDRDAGSLKAAITETMEALGRAAAEEE